MNTRFFRVIVRLYFLLYNEQSLNNLIKAAELT